jgi:hypothetical protein
MGGGNDGDEPPWSQATRGNKSQGAVSTPDLPEILDGNIGIAAR